MSLPIFTNTFHFNMEESSSCKEIILILISYKCPQTPDNIWVIYFTVTPLPYTIVGWSKHIVYTLD